MNVPVIVFFNNKGGVGTTSLVYHLSHMNAEIGHKVLVADLDPQANLTAAFLADDQLEELWPDGQHVRTIYGCIDPLLRGVGDVAAKPHLQEITEELYLIPGDLALARVEDELSQQWPLCHDRKERAFRIVSAFWRIVQAGAREVAADVALVDLGPGLGAINQAALVAADYLVVPLALDLFALQGLRNLGPAVRQWREQWHNCRGRNPDPSLQLPAGAIKPAGYVVMLRAVRLDRPAGAYERWGARIPEVYAAEVLGDPRTTPTPPKPDPPCLGLVKHYRSLIPMAREARKPMFHLTVADGAIGAHAKAVNDARDNFRDLADAIRERCPAARAVD